MGYGNMMGWGGGWGSDHMAGFGLIGLVVLVVIVVWLAARSRGNRSGPAGPRGEDRALTILKERYARGEVDKAEFDARKRDLS